MKDQPMASTIFFSSPNELTLAAFKLLREHSDVEIHSIASWRQKSDLNIDSLITYFCYEAQKYFRQFDFQSNFRSSKGSN
jgi:hypothetical protein